MHLAVSCSRGLNGSTETHSWVSLFDISALGCLQNLRRFQFGFQSTMSQLKTLNTNPRNKSKSSQVQQETKQILHKPYKILQQVSGLPSAAWHSFPPFPVPESFPMGKQEIAIGALDNQTKHNFPSLPPHGLNTSSILQAPITFFRV